MDTVIFNFLHGLSGSFFLFNAFVLISAKYLPYLLMVMVLIFIAKIDDWKKRFLVFLTTTLALVVSSGLLVRLIQILYVRPRPFISLDTSYLFEVGGSSFPSAHAAFLFTLVFIIFVFSKKLGWWLLALVSLNGIARVIAGVHWPLDILGGVLVALIGTGLTLLLLKRPLKSLAQESKSAEADEDWRED